MFDSHHIVVTHAKKVVDHVKKHHHTYLFFGGLAGGIFLVAKIVMLFATSYTLYNAYHDASYADDSVLSSTGIISTGETLTGTVSTGETLTGTTITGEILTGTVSTGEILTGTTITGETLTGITSTGTTTTGNTQSTGEQYGFQTTPLVCSSSGFSINIVSGKLYTGIMNIQWVVPSPCANEIIDLQLYDHNKQWITLARLPGIASGYVFDTKLLGSGFYMQTGLNTSGQTIVLNLGTYSGVAMNSWTGYRLKWFIQSTSTTLFETSPFIIDNAKPVLSGVSLMFSGSSTGSVGVNGLVSLQFASSEILSGVSVFVGTGQATLSNISGSRYTYIYILPTTFSSGYIPYTISYQDFAGFTGTLTGISQLVFDPVYPQITGYNLSGYDFSFITSKLTRATSFVLIKNTTNGWAFSMTGIATGHTFSLPTLSLNTDYDMGIIVKDLAGNESKSALSLKRTGSGVITYSLLATLYGQTLITYSSGVNFLSVTSSGIQTASPSLTSTGSIDNSIKEEFKEDLENFTECKENIEYTKIKLQVKGTELMLNMPSFKKSEIKKLVNSFILYLLKNLEKAPLSDTELQDLALNFDNFSVILKLIKDDNNTCKQNLSNYHLEQFKQALETYGISL